MRYFFLILLSCQLCAGEFLYSEKIKTTQGELQIIEAHPGLGYEPSSGTSGRMFVVFLKGKKVGEIWAHSKLIRVEKLHDECRI